MTGPCTSTQKAQYSGEEISSVGQNLGHALKDLTEKKKEQILNPYMQ
jgi:hypothetical protein